MNRKTFNLLVEPKWDAKRADFWNNPKLWHGIDPTQQMCWMMETVQ